MQRIIIMKTVKKFIFINSKQKGLPKRPNGNPFFVSLFLLACACPFSDGGR